MNEVINNIFQSFGYYQIESGEVSLFKSNLIDDYWVVFTGKPKEINHERQADLLTLCKNVCKDRSLEKNVNLLCLWQVDVIDHLTISELHYLEEDIHYFKKHVLYYTPEELQSFSIMLKVEPVSELLTNHMINPEVFNRYKSKVNNGSWESLLYRIGIKLTFLPIKCVAGEDISNLYASHQQRLIDEPYLTILDEVTQDLDFKYLEGTPDDLLSILSSSIGGKL